MSSLTPIISELLKYKKEENLLFSMPGNKSGIGFLRDDIGKEFVNDLGFLDITEVDPLDNLHNPEGIIKQSQQLLANTYGVKKAYFLVNGSSSGNLASIFSCFKEGDQVLVERNCHKSIYNGLILRKLKPIYIDTNIDFNNEILLPCIEDNILEALEKSNNIKGIILTSPNYYGISASLDNVLKIFKDKGLKIIIDAAHGAHYGFNEKLPKSVFKLAHYIITSAHKTLPSLTQGAYLLVNDENSNVQFYISAFNTTSPSYLIMASLEYGRYYLDKYAKEDYNILIDMADKYRKKINALGKVTILSSNNIPTGYTLDESRYIMILPKGYSGSKLLQYLRYNKIQCEMSFSRGVILILSPFNKEEDFEKIFNSINNLNMEEVKCEYKELIIKKCNTEKILEPFQVYDMNYYEVSLEDSLGKVSKDFIIPYPPGIPVLLPGEKISEDVIDTIRTYGNSYINIIGVSNNKIKVIDIN